MSTSFKRTAAAGFTLIELLIVVIILAIISAIAIPQFTATTTDAKNAAATTNLATVRNAIELYRAQHGGDVNPGAKDSKGATCTTGVAGKGAANSKEALIEQLTYASNAAGQTCSVAHGDFRYGPYLRQGIPADPFGQSNDIDFKITGDKITPTHATGSGWLYDVKSGEFALNKVAEDSDNTGSGEANP